MSFQGGSGEIRFVVTAQDQNAINTFKSVSQEMSAMGNSTVSSTQQMSSAMNQNMTVQRTWAQSLQQNALAISMLGSSVIGLVGTFVSLQRQANTLQRFQNMSANTTRMLGDAQTKLNAVLVKYGANSSEAASAQAKLDSLKAKSAQQTSRITILQEQYNLSLGNLAFSVVPQVITVIGSFVQILQGVGQRLNQAKQAQDAMKSSSVGLALAQGGANASLIGTKGASSLAVGGLQNVARAEIQTGAAATAMSAKMRLAFLRTGIGAAIVAIGAILAAFVTNAFGARDAINQIGAAVGQAVPQLRPLLDILAQIGEVILSVFGGEVPAALTTAKNSITSGFGGAVQKLKGVFGITTTATQDMGEQFTESGKAAMEFSKKIEDLNKASNDLWMALGVKGKERSDLLGNLGLKGMKGGGGFLKDMEAVTESFADLNKIMQFAFALPEWDKIMILPKGLGKKLASEFSSELQDVKENIDPKFKQMIGQLQKDIKADGEKGGKNIGKIMADFLTKHPELYNVLKDRGLIDDKTQTLIENEAKKSAKIAHDNILAQAKFIGPTDAEWAKIMAMPINDPKNFIQSGVNSQGHPIMRNKDPSTHASKAGPLSGLLDSIKNYDWKGLGSAIVAGLKNIGPMVIPALNTLGGSIRNYIIVPLEKLDWKGLGATFKAGLKSIFTKQNLINAGVWMRVNIVDPAIAILLGMGTTLQETFGPSIQAFIKDPIGTTINIGNMAGTFLAGIFGYATMAEFYDAINFEWTMGIATIQGKLQKITKPFTDDPIGFIIGAVKPLADFIGTLFGYKTDDDMVDVLVNTDFKTIWDKVIAGVKGVITGHTIQAAMVEANTAKNVTGGGNTKGGGLFGGLTGTQIFNLFDPKGKDKVTPAGSFEQAEGQIFGGLTNKAPPKSPSEVQGLFDPTPQKVLNDILYNHLIPWIGGGITKWWTDYDKNLDNATYTGPLNFLLPPGFGGKTGDNHFAYGDTGTPWYQMPNTNPNKQYQGSASTKGLPPSFTSQFPGTYGAMNPNGTFQGPHTIPTVFTIPKFPGANLPNIDSATGAAKGGIQGFLQDIITRLFGLKAPQPLFGMKEPGYMFSALQQKQQSDMLAKQRLGFIAASKAGASPGILAAAYAPDTNPNKQYHVAGTGGTVEQQLAAARAANQAKKGVGQKILDAAGSGQFAQIAVGAQEAQKALANLAVQGGKSMQILANLILKNTANLMGNFTTIAVDAQIAQKGLANLAVQGGKSMQILANLILKNTANLMGNFVTIAVRAQIAQKGLANLAVQGGKSFQILANLILKNTGNLLPNFITIQKDAQKAQKSLANLAVQGGKSFQGLANVIGKNTDNMTPNMTKAIPVAAQKTQTALANLSNEGSKSMGALAKASSSMANGIKNNMAVAAKAVKDLQSAIDSLHGKTVKVSATVSGGGLLATATGGTIRSAAKGYVTHGPELMLVGDNPGGRETVAVIPHDNPGPAMGMVARQFGRMGGAGHGEGNDIILNTVLHISGNEIVNPRKLSKKIRMTVGANRDRFG